VQNYWTQKANLPGTPRNGAVGFGIENKGYIGTGYDGDNKLNDFWEYNSVTNTWVQRADFLGSARYGAVGFSINDKGYIGTGYDGNHLKDFYEYSTATDTWLKIVSIGGSKRRDATAFVISGKGYVVSGLDNASYQNDFYEYDPSTGLWTEKRKISNVSDDDYDNDYTSISRINGVGLAFNGKGYIVGGSTSSLLGNVWEYDPTTDLWQEKTAFEGTNRTEAVGFGIGNLGYVATGRSSSYYLDDIWCFNPIAEYDENN
jgi:N-acetylneuraminic acid mutarotase